MSATFAGPAALFEPLTGDEREIRTGLRPAVLDRLAALYSIANPSSDDTIARLGLELRLQEIDDSLLNMAQENARPGWETLPPGELAFEPSNTDCVHGPILLLAAARAATDACAPGEVLAGLEFVRWQRPVRRNIRFVLTEDGATGAPTCGAFLTSAGRRIAFRGDESDGDWVTNQLLFNAITVALASGQMVAGDAKTYRMSVDPSRLSPLQNAMLNDDALAMATAVDFACTLILNLRRGIPALGCGASGVPSRALAEAVKRRQPFDVLLQTESTRLSARGLRVVSHAISIDGGPMWRVTMAESDDRWRLLRLLHARGARS